MTKKNKIMCLSLFLGIFIVLLILATIFDLSINKRFSQLNFGIYYSSNKFARFFEVMGEMPLYIFLSLAIVIINRNVLANTNGVFKWLLLALFILLLIGTNFLAVTRIVKHINSFPKNTSALYFKDGVLTVMFEIFLSFELSAIYIFASKITDPKIIEKLLPFALVIIITAILSQFVVQGLKIVNSRLRFAGMMKMYDFNFDGFTPWYKINGIMKLTKEQSSFLDNNALKSMPSGHTASAGIVYAMFALPLIFEKLKTRRAISIIIAISVFITGIVAVSRIIMGVHYFSDVLFGGTITFVSAIVSILIVRKISRRFKILKI